MPQIKNEPRNTLIGRMPKIGIRPTIDGRRLGVRESLEEPTMAKARAVVVGRGHDVDVDDAIEPELGDGEEGADHEPLVLAVEQGSSWIRSKLI